MLRPKRRIAKRELKQDALITTYAKLATFYGRERKRIGIVITTVIVLFLAFIVYVKNQSANEEKASSDLGRIFLYFDNGQYDIAVDGIPEKNLPGLRSIVENYGNTPSGELARFYLASALYQKGNYDEAREQFEDFDGEGQLLEAARYSGIAACYEAKGGYADAAEFYEKAVGVASQDVSAAENLNNAARNYARDGNKEKAVELYKKIKKAYPATNYGREADRHISRLSV